ncbi:MAG TPA: hypothetical protein VMF87_07210 [Streptosporangiaceae bacterium]|nr:hypothetical protein [Streptosporangiaceae bacterium]
MAKGDRNRQQAREKIAQARAAEARRRRRRLWLGVAGVVAVVAAVAGITVAVSGGGDASNPPGVRLAPLHTLGALRPAPAPGSQGPEAVPIPPAAPLASTAPAATGGTVDGIGCQTNEQTLFHIHAHLTIFINGTPRQVPAAVGIPGARAQTTPNGPFIDSGTCFYWLHTHAADGVIHIESPVQRTYTLGQFFDEWGLPLGPGQVGPARGHVTALYNGQVFQGNPRNIPLTAHAQIQLEVGKPLVAPVSIAWPSGL